MASSSEQNNRNCWPSNTVIQEAVEVNLSGRQGVDARAFEDRFQSQSDLYKLQKWSEKERKEERNHTHTEMQTGKFKYLGEGKIWFFFPQM